MNERIMYYMKTISPLKEKASAKVAINLCQDNAFKEVAMHLEKPTYGCILPLEDSPFVSDPEILSAWTNKTKKYGWQIEYFRVKRWEEAVDDQCRRLTEGLPRSLRHGVHAWIHRIALEYLCYSRRLESFFAVSRYFLMTFLTREYWKEDCRLDEVNIALNLLGDKRLAVLQKYQIACTYCLCVHVPGLWEKLTESEKGSIRDDLDLFRERIRSGVLTPYEDYTMHVPVLLWSCQMDGDREMKLAEGELWTSVAQHATYCGNHVTAKLCWERLGKPIHHQIVIDMALQSLQRLESVVKNRNTRKIYKLTLLTNDSFGTHYGDLKNFVLPSYHSELVRFFLTQMDEEQQFIFFRKSFEKRNWNSLLKCFLYWPFQDHFIPTINRLWGIVPKEKYKECMFFLVRKCSGNDETETPYYDYHSLLWTLWETTPEEYKQCVFNDEVNGHSHDILLRNLIVNSQEGNEALFKHILSYQPQEARRAMLHSCVGQDYCLELLKKGKWSFLNWLLEEFLDWPMDLNTDKTQFKLSLISHPTFPMKCADVLRIEGFAKVESMLNFCTSADEMKIKSSVAKYTCESLLDEYDMRDSFECVWDDLDKILAWGMDTREKIRYLKDIFLSERVTGIHYGLVFIKREWEEVQRLYQWLDLSTEEIKELKMNAIFRYFSSYLRKEKCGDKNTFVEPMKWCLTDEEMVKEFKNIVEKKYSQNEDYTELLEYIKYIERELFCCLREE